MTAAFPRRTAAVAALLAAAVLAAYLPVLGHGFLNYDDNEYVTGNWRVKEGLRPAGVLWAFTTLHAANWHPLTWLSHMLDVSVWGLNPWGHHLTSLLLHMANAILLFLVFRAMTGFLWRGAFIAAVFALHPLHVESVAWVAERKDVLSTFFGLLAMLAYARYAVTGLARRFRLAAVFLALGLMAKPMLVTLPLLFLMLDYWPLGRWRAAGGTSGAGTLLREKAIFLALAGAASAVTLFAQREVIRMAAMPAAIRLANGVQAYLHYLGQFFYPARLSAFHPYPKDFPPAWTVSAAAFFMSAATLLFLLAGRRRPYLATGWLWYLVMLLPVIGLVQVGSHAMADRYTYLPLTGIAVMVAWGVPDLVRLLGRGRARAAGRALLAAAVLVLSAGLVRTRVQVGYWRSTLDLFSQALDNTRGNYVAHNIVGMELASQDRRSEAMGHFRAAILMMPDFPEARNNLGLALAKEGRVEEALEQFTAALKADPGYADAYNNLGTSLAWWGKVDLAMNNFRRALEINPEHGAAHNNMAAALFLKEDYAGAWREVRLARKYGQEPLPVFIDKLKDKTPAPAE